MGFAALFSQTVDGLEFVAASEAVSGFAAVAAVIAGVTVMVRRQTGERQRPFLLGMGGAALISVLGTLMASLVDPDAGMTLTTAQRWSVMVVGFGLSGLALWLARNPVRFPQTFDGQVLMRSPLLNLIQR
ncbi:MAG: hypothetical protein KJO18_03945 [Acidimicrobiia bacterium]|nr:hypothetical protein [Acidimicrobiia bacterium]